MKNNPYLALAVGDSLRTRQALEQKIQTIRQIQKIDPTKTAEADNPVLRIFAKDADWTSVLGEARTFPLISEQRIFWVKQAELIDEEAQAMLDFYFQHPSPFSYFLFESEGFSGKRKFTDWLVSQGGELMALDAPKFGQYGKFKSQARVFILEKTKSLNISLTPEALRLLEELCGDHFVLLDNTLEKLSLLCPGGKVSEKEVESLADSLDDRTGFKLAEALAGKNVREVMEIYFNLYESNPYQSAELLGLLNWQMRRLFEAKKMLERGMNRTEIASRVKMSSYFLDRFIANAQRFTPGQYQEAFRLLFETDEAIKTGRAAANAAMELLLLRLCS
ncbi:MAG: DNA polymerase III subunit delta [Candidatus Omnitrophica bacterium]|nr:DNA polymerase III subunit delta [Candidatus Omnitrophota bacterium]